MRWLPSNLDFNKINFDGENAWLWSAVTKNIKGTRLQILPYMIGGPARKDEAAKKGSVSIRPLKSRR